MNEQTQKLWQVKEGSVPQNAVFCIDAVAEGGGSFQGMARKLRVQYPGAVHHVMNRGDWREVIFLDDSLGDEEFRHERAKSREDFECGNLSAGAGPEGDETAQERRSGEGSNGATTSKGNDDELAMDRRMAMGLPATLPVASVNC